MIETALQDLRFGFRMLRRSPGFSILAILCLTLGIGANAAVFSWIEGILIRPFPAVAHQERLLAMSGTARGTPGSSAVSWPDFVDFQRSCKLIDLNSLPHTIVGVAPEGFYGTFVGYAHQFWVPTSMQERFDAGGYKLEDRGARWIEGFAQLKPGVTREQAQEEISAVAKRLEADYPACSED
jgi:hypothetical protein